MTAHPYPTPRATVDPDELAEFNDGVQRARADYYGTRQCGLCGRWCSAATCSACKQAAHRERRRS